ncbi:multidrug transporter [Psychrosphaera saromensis]|nr:multidrug transporter [Psychrosphaera saromensis]GLQ13079.1 multidrug transporter [Psychrosphaera saromensis]
MQTWRNALQSKLSKQVNTSGVTLARFLFATPIAVIYLLSLYSYETQIIPTFNQTYLMYIVIASVVQIFATALMVILFKQRNFAVGAGLAKSEALAAGVLGMLFFGSQLSILGWLGIALGTCAVFILSGFTSRSTLNIKTVLIGLSSGTCFALTMLFVREASLELNVPFPYSAAWSLVWVLCIQTVLLGSYIFYREPETFKQLKQHPRITLAISFTSCIGSIGWFSAAALQYVAYVKTVGQIEILFTIILSVFWLKQPVKKNELVGLTLISIAAVLVMWS